MISNIVVFKPPEIQNVTSNKTEQEILYDTFVKNASIPHHHFDSFMEMENREGLDTDIQSTLPSILIKTILPYCTPIIKTIPEFTVKNKVVDIFKKNRIVDDKLDEKFYSVGIQLEYPIDCKFEYDNVVDNKRMLNTVTIPKHESFKVIGVVIPANMIKKRDNSFLNITRELHPVDIFKAGSFGLVEFQSGAYTQSRLNDLMPNPINKIHNTVYFVSDDDARTKIQIINKYIKYVNKFYQNNLEMVYRYLYGMPFSSHIVEQTKLFNIFNPKFNTKQKKVIHDKPSIIISKLIHTKLSNSSYANDFMFDNNKIFDQVHQILMLGISNSSSKKKLQELDTKKLHDQTIIDFNKLKFLKKLEYAKKKAIAYNKFQLDGLSNLTTTQEKVVALEYDKMEKFYKSIKEHSGDFKIVNSLFWSMKNGKTDIIKERLADLDKLVKIPKNLDDPKLSMLQNAKKINLICPHVVARAQRMIKPTQNELVKSGLIRDYLINKFSLPVNVDGYFCRICGELLADADAEEILKYISGKRVSFVMEYDKLKTQMWKEVAHVITTYVRFRDAVNHKNIISSITNTLRPEMGVIETNLTKIKSNSKDSIKDLIRIYTVIYTFAIVVNMINKNYGKITFSMRPGLNKSARSGGSNKHVSRKSTKSSIIDTVKPSYESDDKISDFMENTKNGGKSDTPRMNQKILQNVINNALFLVMRILNVTINNVTSVTMDSVKPILIKAYKWAVSLQLETNQVTKEDEIDEIVVIKNDKIYKYISIIMNFVEFYKKNSTSSIQSHNVKSVLGRSWSKIEADFKENVSVFATATVPEQWSDTMRGKYIHGSFKFLIEYVKNKLYNEFVVPYTKPLIDHDKTYLYLKTMEEELVMLQKRRVLRPFNNIFLQENYMLRFNNFKPSNIKIDKYYDNNGKRHKFDIFVYQSANAKGVLSGTKKEYSKSDVNKWLNSHDIKKTTEFKKLFIVDERCSICKTLLSQTKNVSVEKAMDKISDMAIFFNYFENRCPTGGLHNFIISTSKHKESSCSKCGITKNIVDKHDKKYYDKYIKTYKKIVSDKLLIQKADVLKISSVKKDLVIKNSYPEWKINNAHVLELTRTFKITYNVWVNLGLTINQKFSLIKSEKINPSATANPRLLALRNIQLHSYYLHIVTMFYLVKNHNIVQNIPYDLKQLMSKNKSHDLHKKLINIDQTTLKKYDYYKDNASPLVVSNFLLHSISHTLITMYKSMQNANMNIAYDVIKFIISSIIESEKMIAKPDLTKFKASVVASNDVDLGADLSNVVDFDGDDIQDGYVSDAESEKSLGEMSDTNPDDEFATGDLDIEAGSEENMNNNAMGF
jgi:hypothetical protein